MKRLRVLVSSHEFSPDQGSECAVGWNIATRLAAFHDVTVLCADGPAGRPNLYREAVSNYFKLHGNIRGLRVVFVEQPRIALRYSRVNSKLMTLTRGVGWQPLYYMGLDGWHRAALGKARELGLRNFDVAHQLTPISFLKPGYLWTSDIPFFWGPVGGMYKVPRSFARMGGIESLAFETIRSSNIEWRIRLSPQFKRVVEKARRIWTVSENEARIIDSLAKDKTSPMIDTAPSAGDRGYLHEYDGRRRLRACWSGRHEPRKALPLLLRALQFLPDRERILLDIIGSGPETVRWKRLAGTLSLTNIIWHGLLPYDKARQTMGQADIFIHSSFREAASMVVLEALGWGLPVICHDACGMAVAVNDTCGIKVPFISPGKSIEGFREALDRVIRTPQLIAQFSSGALRRASELSWDAKVREIAHAYELVQ
jgi:glycosyltransferase involved in cell wall biosynthesis